MNTTTATAENVGQAIKTAGVPVRELAHTVGIPYTTLWRKLKGRSPFTVEDIDVIAEAINVHPAELVKFVVEDAA